MDIGRNLLGLSSQSERLRRDEFWALNDISFEVKRGETLGIIGPNGSGKTTLLKLLNGIFWPDKGKITIRGRVGALIEVGAGFHPMLTGRENIYVNAAILGMTKKEVDKKFDEIVEFADIGDFIDTPVKFYSSGMFVRLGFAVAVHCEPDILLVDEVLAVGDVQFQVKCFRKLREYKEAGKTTILVTHDMGAIQKHTGKGLLLHQGCLVDVDTPKNVVNRYLALMSKSIKPKEIGGKYVCSNDHGLEIENTNILPQFEIIEDLCPKRANYNKNEFRYGNGFAKIIDFQILNAQGEEVTSIKSRDIVLIRFKVKGYQSVEKPVFGIIVKTKDGIELYGTNTLLTETEMPPIKRGEQVLVESKIHFILQSGDYFLSAGLAEINSEGISPIDRRYDLIHITILPSDKSFGIVNLVTDIKVYSK
jgi:lipopolysaccharide transport system ATP-binding protein